VTKFLQGSAVTYTVLCGLPINILVANLLQCASANNYENEDRCENLLIGATKAIVL